MADVGHEVFAGVLELLEAGQLVEDEDGAVAPAEVVQEGGSVDPQPTFGRVREPDLLAEHLLLRPQQIHQLGQFVQAEGLDERAGTDVGRQTEKVHEGAVGQQDSAVLVQHDQSLDHAVEQGLLLRLEAESGRPGGLP